MLVSIATKERWERERNKNLALYGYASTPEARERAQKLSAKTSLIYLELYGTTKTPEQRETQAKR